jgi:hypothetical protein
MLASLSRNRAGGIERLFIWRYNMNGINILQTELEYKKRWVRINKIVKTIKKSYKEELFIVNSKTRTLYFELVDLIKTDISYQRLEK